jgi:F0F1-type ATP synthase assembly protein I
MDGNRPSLIKNQIERSETARNSAACRIVKSLVAGVIVSVSIGRLFFQSGFKFPPVWTIHILPNGNIRRLPAD